MLRACGETYLGTKPVDVAASQLQNGDGVLFAPTKREGIDYDSACYFQRFVRVSSNNPDGNVSGMGVSFTQSTVSTKFGLTATAAIAPGKFVAGVAGSTPEVVLFTEVSRDGDAVEEDFYGDEAPGGEEIMEMQVQRLRGGEKCQGSSLTASASAACSNGQGTVFLGNSNGTLWSVELEDSGRMECVSSGAIPGLPSGVPISCMAAVSGPVAAAVAVHTVVMLDFRVAKPAVQPVMVMKGEDPMDPIRCIDCCGTDLILGSEQGTIFTFDIRALANGEKLMQSVPGSGNYARPMYRSRTSKRPLTSLVAVSPSSFVSANAVGELLQWCPESNRSAAEHAIFPFGFFPINDTARAGAQIDRAGQFGAPEWQCQHLGNPRYVAGTRLFGGQAVAFVEETGLLQVYSF